MRVSKSRLKNIVKKELRRLRENCGPDHVDQVPEPVSVVELEPAVVAENEAPVTNMLIEMEVASRALEQVVESVQNAAQLCHNCDNGIAAQAPVVEAMVVQATALQEMLDAQAAVIQETAGSDQTVLDAVSSLF
tara:strand:- start:141 stop:542 length:402 start_codon:yes stop_codon:yes gene_type:complete